jgi:hypothetical protein
MIPCILTCLKVGGLPRNNRWCMPRHQPIRRNLVFLPDFILDGTVKVGDGGAPPKAVWVKWPGDKNASTMARLPWLKASSNSRWMSDSVRFVGIGSSFLSLRFPLLRIGLLAWRLFPLMRPELHWHALLK